jgi:hypothetical protein
MMLETFSHIKRVIQIKESAKIKEIFGIETELFQAL